VYDLLLLLFLCAMTLAGVVMFGGVRVWSIGILLVGVFGVGVLYCIRPFVQEELRPFKLPPGIVFLCLFTLYALLRVPFSAVRDDALFEVLCVAGFVAAYYVWTGIGARMGRWRIGMAILLFGVALACWYALIQHVHGDNHVLMMLRPKQYGMRASATYMCPNHFAHLLEIVMCLCLGLMLLRSCAVWLRILALYSFVLACPVLFLSQSRSGWLGALSGLCVTALLVLLRRGRKWFFIMLIVLPALAGAAGGVLWFASPMVRERVGGMNLASPDGAVSIRLVMWRDTWEMVKDAPLLGHGGGAFRWIYPHYKTHARQLWARYTHNEFLQLLAEYGVVGAVLLLGALFGFTWKMLRAVLQADRERDAVLAAVALGAVAASLVHAVFDFNLHIYANMLLLAAVCGMASSCLFASGYWPVRRLNPPWWGMVYSVLIVLLAVGLLASATYALSYGFTSRGMQRELQFRQHEAMRDYRRAAWLDPLNWRPVLGQAGVVRGQSFWERDPQIKKEKAQQAITLYDQVQRLNPYEFEAQYGKSTMYQLLGDDERAFECLQEVLDYAPNEVFFLNRAGIYLRLQGRNREALEFFERAEKLEPTHETRVNLRLLRSGKAEETSGLAR
jgi:O-antigen ligase